MASHDKDVGPLLPNPWDAILEAVKEQLPSLDSDSSSSNCEEEELFIFQRNQTALIPDLSEELAEDPDGAWVTSSGSPPEPAVVPVESAGEPWGEWNAGPQAQESVSLEGRAPGRPLQSCDESSSLLRMPVETPTWQDDDGDTAFNTSTSQSPCQGPQGEATLSPQEAGLQTEPPGAASWAQEGSDSANRRALRRERRKMIEKDILHKVTWDAQDPACQDLSGVKEMPCDAAETLPEGPQRGPPLLSLQQLEEWDLDQVLQSLTEQEELGDGASGAAWWAADRLQGQDHAKPSTQDRLMGQLTLLCAMQSRAFSSAWRVSSNSSGHFRRHRLSPSCQQARVPEARRLRPLEIRLDPAPGGKQHVTLWAERQSAQARPPGGSPRALGDPLGPGTAREALVPPLGQL
uniref:Dynein axonemal assembly factor 8 n=1 Tax=Phocoena sinus TaxID=42100 RepID=A0A8C9BP81_PHOSS